MDNIFLIIIDQLREDYLQYLPKCAELLPYKAVCDTDSIPTSTEAMHTNISTGLYPKDHGFVSKNLRYSKPDGLSQIVHKMKYGGLHSLASLGQGRGYSCYVLGGKSETVSVLGLQRDCLLKVYYKKRLKRSGFFTASGRDDFLVEHILNYMDGGNFKDINSEFLDSKVLDIFDKLEESIKYKSPVILTLPSVDSIGHKYGPNSFEIVSHLGFIDNKISEIIQRFSDDSFFIFGDHGCRLTSRYVIESNQSHLGESLIYHLENGSFELKNSHFFNVKEDIDDLSYDGGVLRIWLKNKSNDLSKEDENLLSEYGQIFKIGEISLNKGNKFIENSQHENLGDIVVVAHQDSTFCKNSWLSDTALRKIQLREAKLNKQDLPLGEHGTYFSEDREVPFISNHNFGNSLKNVEIFRFLEKIMNRNTINHPL